MRVLAAWRDNAANYYRTQAPALVLKYRGFDVDVKTPSMGDASEYDILWLQMHADPLTDIVVREFKDAGKKVLYDVDDWLFDIPPSWGSYDHFYQRGSGRPSERLILHERAIAYADLITCTTEYLAEKLCSKGYKTDIKDVDVLQNCVMMGDWDVLIDTKHEQDGPVLGWFGTGNHWDDWCEIADSVDRALHEVKGYLALMGAPELLACFPDRLRARTMVSPIVPMKRFHDMRKLIKACDVGLAWATDRLEVSRCRSPLKAFQWGAAGVPLVVSGTVYGEVTRDDFQVAANVATLAGKIVEKIEEANFPKEQIVNRWRERVWKEHSFETQSWRWLDVLEKLYNGEHNVENRGF